MINLGRVDPRARYAKLPANDAMRILCAGSDSLVFKSMYLKQP